MNHTVSILGSWDPRWIEDHRAWLCSFGPHYDGWKNPVSRHKRELLKNQGAFYFYAYLPRSKRGCGHVVFRLKCDAAAFTEKGQRCVHKHRRHHDSGRRNYSLCFKILKIDELKEHLDVRAFKTLQGNPLRNGQSTLAMPLVEARRVRVK